MKTTMMAIVILSNSQQETLTYECCADNVLIFSFYKKSDVSIEVVRCSCVVPLVREIASILEGKAVERNSNLKCCQVSRTRKEK
jgi:hypothetical protein